MKETPARPRRVFVAGGTGYLGRRLIPRLRERGHTVTALVRRGSEGRIDGSIAVGDPLDRASFEKQIYPTDTFVQMVGVPHPSPAKGDQFRAIDLVSVRASVAAAREAGVGHFVYVSVAQPAPIMQEYIAVRAEGEALLRSSGMNATILRPWYVLGPGHRWPVLLLPFYGLCALLPWTRAGARRLGLVSLDRMVGALVHAVENPPAGVRVVEVPEIRATSSTPP